MTERSSGGGAPGSWLLGECDSAPGLLGGPFRASTITCRVAKGRTWGPPRPRSPGCRLARRSGHLVPAGTRAAPYRPLREAARDGGHFCSGQIVSRLFASTGGVHVRAVGEYQGSGLLVLLCRPCGTSVIARGSKWLPATHRWRLQVSQAALSSGGGRTDGYPLAEQRSLRCGARVRPRLRKIGRRRGSALAFGPGRSSFPRARRWSEPPGRRPYRSHRRPTNEAVLPERVQEALGELVGAASEGLLALSVGVGLGVLSEMLEQEVDEVVGRRADGSRADRGQA